MSKLNWDKVKWFYRQGYRVYVGRGSLIWGRKGRSLILIGEFEYFHNRWIERL